MDFKKTIIATLMHSHFINDEESLSLYKTISKMNANKNYNLSFNCFTIPNGIDIVNHNKFHLFNRIFWYFLKESKGSYNKIHILTTEYNNKCYFIGAIVFSSPLNNKRVMFFPAYNFLSEASPEKYIKGCHTTIDYTEKLNLLNIHFTDEYNVHENIELNKRKPNEPLFSYQVNVLNLEDAYYSNPVGKYITENAKLNFNKVLSDTHTEVIDLTLPNKYKNKKFSKFYLDVYFCKINEGDNYLTNRQIENTEEHIFGCFKLQDNIWGIFYALEENYDDVNRIIYCDTQRVEWNSTK
jgi:hypothetical protein